MERQSSLKGKEKELQESTSIKDGINKNSISNRWTKLDGVLFHFYSKTSAVITQSRLSHYNPTQILTTQIEQQPQTQSSIPLSSSSSTPTNNAADQSTSTAGTSPTSKKASKWFALELEENEVFKDELRLWRSISSLIPEADLAATSPSTSASTSPVPPMVIDVILDTSFFRPNQVLLVNNLTDGRRVRADGLEMNDSDQIAKPQKPIILESWRLNFDPFSPPSPPELPTLYKRSITHFRSLFTLSRTLPTHRLYERLKSNIDIESNLKLGCRIGLGNTIEGQDELEEIPLNQVVGNAEKDFLTSIKKQDHLQTHKFGDILTPIGNLKCSVTYRTNVEFSVDDVENLGGLKDLDVDEDFFKPASIIPVVAAAKPTSAPAAASPVPSSKALPERTRSLLSTSADRRVGSASSTTPTSPTEPTASSRSSPTPSLFSTSAPGRPMAGLSNLRRTGSNAGGIGLTTSPNTGATGSFPSGSTPPSPALAAALSAGDPAFLAHGRRGSSSEKRIRTLGSIAAEKASPSPPSSSLAGSQQSQLSSGGYPANRPASFGPSLRSGSYSPSSPSPLAQQMTGRNSPASMSRTGEATASLRSIFQSYAPSSAASQSSISLSRTPPRSSGIPRGSDFLPSPLGGVATESSTSLAARSSPASTPSDELPPSASSTSFRRPTVAPQMIKRYSSTFSYRSGRQYAGSLGGAEAAPSAGSGPGSLESTENLPFSRSWAARLEQRQSFASRSAGRDEGAGSFASRYARSRQNQGPSSQDDDIDDFVRMIDSRAQLSSSIRSSTAGSTMAGEVGDSFTRRSPSAIASSSIRGNSPLSRSRVDTMLSRMVNSMQVSPTSNSGSSSPQGTSTSVGEACSPAHARSPLALGTIVATSTTTGSAPAKRGGGANSPHRRRSSALQHRSSGSQEFCYSYDDEDETAGRLELNQEDCPSNVNHSQELERRRADADLARNFGEELSSIRGKGRLSRSPWRLEGKGG